MVKNIIKRYRIQENDIKTVNVFKTYATKDESAEVLPKNNKNDKRKKTVTTSVVSDDNNEITNNKNDE